MYNYYSYLKPCALNAEFQHFIPRYNKIPYSKRTSLKEGVGGEKRPQDKVKTG
jgi:hypothetical protein